MIKIGLTIQDTKQKESPMAHQLNKGKGSYNRQAAKKMAGQF